MQPDTILPKEPRIKIYTSLVTQLSTNSPTEIILQNTTELTISWIRSNTGDYTGTLSDSINMNKTALYCNGGLLQGWGFNIRLVNENTIQLTTGINGSPNDGLLLNTMIEIKIYQ